MTVVVRSPSYDQQVNAFRRELLTHYLRATGGNRTRAAELLGVERTYLMRLVKTHGVDVPAPRREKQA